MDDIDERAVAAFQIGMLISKYNDPEKMLPIIATALHVWCGDNGKDVTEIAGMFIEMVMTAQGLEIEEGNDK